MLTPVGLFAQHPLQGILHHEPDAVVTHVCKAAYCNRVFTGKVRAVLNEYREHVLDRHFDQIEDCGCCGCFHFPEFAGDCREDWERF